MAIQMALEKTTNDLILAEGGGIVRVSSARFVVQQVQCKLKTILGEWLLDTSIGWINLSDFEKHYSSHELEDRARKIILDTQSVREIVELNSHYNQRVFTISFKAKTLFGDIDVTVPWDNVPKS